MDEPEVEIIQEEEFRERFSLSPKEIKQSKEKMIFDSIRYPGQKIRKRAYVYELLTNKNYSINQINRLAQCGMKTIYKVKEMIASHYPTKAYYEETKRGRPCRMNRNVKQQLILQGSGSISDAALAKSLSLQFNYEKELSRSLINLYRKKYGFKYKPPKHRQKLTQKQKTTRKTFVYSIFSIPTFPWRKIVFSDESRVCLRNDGKWVWRRRGDITEEVYEDLEKYPIGIMIYGAIGLNYKSKLVFTNINIDSETYAGNIEMSGMLEDLNEILASKLT